MNKAIALLVGRVFNVCTEGLFAKDKEKKDYIVGNGDGTYSCSGVQQPAPKSISSAMRYGNSATVSASGSLTGNEKSGFRNYAKFLDNRP